MARRTTRRFFRLVVVGLGVGLLGVLVASPGQTAEASGQARARAVDPPNIVLVLSDDQPTGTMAAMPGVLSRIAEQGQTFRNGVIPTSVCCPSRAALLSGDFAHTTGVYSNSGEYFGGWPAFEDDENRTLVTELSDAGYRTALFGKYMNGYTQYGWGVDGEASIPPGWDQFVVFNPLNAANVYYAYSLVGTQMLGPYGRTAADYSTDVLSSLAVDFVQETPSSRPFFLMLSVFGPHSPSLPAPRHDGSWADRAIPTPRGINEKNMTDKPAWMQDLPLLSKSRLESRQRDRMETLRSLDEATIDLIRALGDRASNTLFVYLSDNGVMQGIHRLEGKNVPYRAAHEVPLYMRWDGVIEPGSKTNRVTPNIDITATMAEAAGVSWPMDGISALTGSRKGVVLEAVSAGQRPAYCGWRSPRYLYVRYSGGAATELYDYQRDPDELHNVAGEAEYRQIRNKLAWKAKQNCQPFPPDFSWN